MHRSKLLIVSEGYENSNDTTDIKNQTELVTLEQRNELECAFLEIFSSVTSLGSARDLFNAELDDDFVVFPYGYGQGSINRVVHATSYCEVKKLRYIGADSYTRLVARDKHLSKLFASNFGFKDIPSVLIRRPADIPRAAHLIPPLIIKPNSFSGSRNIDESSIANSIDIGTGRILELLDFDNVLVEEFLDFEEVSICLLGNNAEGAIVSVVQRVYDPGYVQTFSFPPIEENTWKGKGRYDVLQKTAFPQEIIENSLRMLKCLAKCPYLRIDGRFDGTRFYLIEITPDGSLASSDTFARAMQFEGLTHVEMLRFITQDNDLSP